MLITTIEPNRQPKRTLVAHKPRTLPSPPREAAFDRIAHARQSWRFYMDGARAGRCSGSPARAARCLEAAATWRAILARAIAGV